MDRHTPKGSVRTGHGVPCRALPLIKTKKEKKKEKKKKKKLLCNCMNMKLIYSRPRHNQSQGKVERYYRALRWNMTFER